ncbi:hypothetical protein FRD01_22590 [Microvenator marinus]|uniref:Uncharacterized protein n=1 Tax=Microvenator marinus TaxID=2600177 RepID=A0A5B8XXR8_9DELT|nr:hypothetical protein [Microvenator marinus]QED29971.1 hypothetical protein FRD01_22590 [Microvenator marinus]
MNLQENKPDKEPNPQPVRSTPKAESGTSEQFVVFARHTENAEDFAGEHLSLKEQVSQARYYWTGSAADWRLLQEEALLTPSKDLTETTENLWAVAYSWKGEALPESKFQFASFLGKVELTRLGVFSMGVPDPKVVGFKH